MVLPRRNFFPRRERIIYINSNAVTGFTPRARTIKGISDVVGEIIR